MAQIIQEPFSKEGLLTAEAEKMFWEFFELPELHINEKEVNYEAIKRKLVTYGFEAGEAHQAINDLIRAGVIAKYNTESIIRTSLYAEYQKKCKECEELRNNLQNLKTSDKKAHIFRVPKEMCNKAYAGLLLSVDGAYLEVDEGGNVVRFLSTESYNKEFKIDT